MPDARTIELTIPGTLGFRDVAVRVVMESCRILSQSIETISAHSQAHGGDRGQSASNGADDNGTGAKPGTTSNPLLPLPDGYDFEDEFTLAFTSAFSEIFNNIPIHAYSGQASGMIQFAIEIGVNRLAVEITDTGKSFDIDDVPLPDELPIGGMGIHIARMMLDELEYQPGPPNRWRLVKYVQSSSDAHPQPERPSTKQPKRQ